MKNCVIARNVAQVLCLNLLETSTITGTKAGDLRSVSSVAHRTDTDQVRAAHQEEGLTLYRDRQDRSGTKIEGKCHTKFTMIEGSAE